MLSVVIFGIAVIAEFHVNGIETNEREFLNPDVVSSDINATVQIKVESVIGHINLPWQVFEALSLMYVRLRGNVKLFQRLQLYVSVQAGAPIQCETRIVALETGARQNVGRLLERHDNSCRISLIFSLNAFRKKTLSTSTDSQSATWRAFYAGPLFTLSFIALRRAARSCMKLLQVAYSLINLPFPWLRSPLARGALFRKMKVRSPRSRNKIISMRRPTKGRQLATRAPVKAAKIIRAVITQTTANNKFSLLASALKQTGFWEQLDTARKLASTEPSDFRILIKPDLELFNPGDPTGTDPELVEHLIDLLCQRNYRCVAVGDACNVWDLWLENRDVCVLAELVGYHFVTKHKHTYDVVDLREEILAAGFPAESVLRGTGLAKRWLDAQFRINFAKNKTHDEFGYALCVHNLLGILPLRDKEYHYRHRLKWWDVCADLLKRTPVHFNIIDAFVSNHGSEGTRAAHPLQTRTIITSTNALLADWAGALKMQIDPYLSPINAKALRDIGLPKRYEIVGDLSPYQDWKNVPPILLESVRKRNEAPTISRVVKPWLQSVNKELFPFKDMFNDQINALATKYLANLDSDALAFWGMVGVNCTIGFIHKSLEAFRTMYNKERLRWKDAPLDIELADYSPSDYEAVLEYMAPLQMIICQTPAEPNGLRWRYLDGSVLFEFSRLIQVPFKDFVDRVDISKAVQSMNDYIGGACVPVKRDRAGRIIYQAERNIYLPQPNWMVLFGGKVIDVGKLEYVQYNQREHKISWRTLKSNNDSAQFDDGIVTFARENADQTRVTIVARQKFTLPLFWQP